MATLITNADGNLTGASTFCTTDTATGALNLIRNSNTGLPVAGTQLSVTFTVTNGAVIDGVLLYVGPNVATTPTGTFKVALNKGGVEQASVTVDKIDIPYPPGGVPGPVFFKFTSTALGDGGANWTIGITTTGTITFNHYRTQAVTGAFTRALRTTTAATAAAGDNLYIVGELTGAGTHNSRAVTMDSTAATVYGNGLVNTTTVYGGQIAVSNWATLSYGTAASTNYILRIAGNLNVFSNSTLNIGSSGAEIPRTSTAVLEFQPVSADGDFGLNVSDGTFNAAGLSRTSGKDVVKCKLTADVVSSSLFVSGSATNGTNAFTTALEATSNSPGFAGAFTDNTTSGAHGTYYLGTNVTNTTQTITVWLARGTGLNNRYMRLLAGSNLSPTLVSNGFYSDIDLQAGTVGTVTALGTGTATSVSIVAEGRGFTIRMTGKVSTATAQTYVHMLSCAVAGTISYVGNTTQCFQWDHVALVTTSSISDTTFNVDTDTGWLSGDAVCVASTTQIALNCNAWPLNANAGASSFTSSLYPFSGTNASTYSGTSPTQAEIGLITRNVKIRSTSPTLMAYVYGTALSTVTLSWVEMYYVGAGANTKRGLELDGGAIANPKSVTYCSIHDCDDSGVYCNYAIAPSLNLTFSNNVLWRGSVTILWPAANGDWIMDSNLMILGDGFYLGGVAGVFTNNTAAGVPGASSIAFTLGQTATIGTFDGNTAHSCQGYGIDTANNTSVSGAITNFTAWRCGYGVHIDSNYNYSTHDLTFDNLLIFGCASGATGASFGMTNGDAINISNSVIAGEVAYPCHNTFGISPGNIIALNLVNVDMSGVGGGGIFAPHTLCEFSFLSNTMDIQGVANNCKFGAPSLFENRTWDDASYYSFQKFNQVAGDHRTEMKYGQVRTDTTTYNTAAPSMRMTPNSASYKLESAPKGKGILFPIESGNTVGVSVMVRKDTSYHGNQPRLIARANAAIGIDEDEVLATAVGTTSTTPATYDGVVTANVVLSNGGLTVTHGNTGGSEGAVSASFWTTGKYYFEVTVQGTTTSGTSNQFGIIQAGKAISTGDNADDAAVVTWAGTIYINGANMGVSISSFSVGSVVCVAVDMTNRLIWFRLGSGNWNNSGSADPATGAGGLTIPGVLGWAPHTAFANLSPANAAVTANFGASAFAHTVPSGFTSGWLRPTYTGTATWDSLTGTTPTATDDGVVELIVDCDGTVGWINVDDWSVA